MQNRPLQIWLFSCAALVFLMIIVGAITRLSGSGLSITEWKPLIGAVPPLSESEWTRVFDLYKQSPQFQKENFWMDLADFKAIFFWEWFHRLLGRLIGAAFALPLLYFWAAKKIPQGYGLKFAGLFLLGGAQGALGWYMVKSGLVDIPAVSHYRLAAHLFTALLIYAAMIWLGLSLGEKRYAPVPRVLFMHALAVLALILCTILWGAFTAGLDAGLIYNDSFPLMGGQILPPDFHHFDPAWINFFQQPSAVQFIHRWLAVLTVAAILSLWAHAQFQNAAFSALHGLAVMALIQMGLGIVTLLSGVVLPLAAAHQAGGVIVLTLMIVCLHRLSRLSS